MRRRVKTWRKLSVFLLICTTFVTVMIYRNHTYTQSVHIKLFPTVPTQNLPESKPNSTYNESSKSFLPTYGVNDSIRFSNSVYFGTKHWRPYYPAMSSFLSTIENGQVQWPVPISQTTSAKFSFVKIQPADSAKKYKVGDFLRAIVQAKNGYDEAKGYGGDYFHVRLIGVSDNGQPNGNALAPEVQDLGNGTYSVIAPLLWSGESRLIVELVHSSEAVATLISKTSGFVGQGIAFYGTYLNGEKHECNVGLEIRDPLNPPCNFSRPDKGITWFCYRPGDKMCTKLKWIAIRNVEEQSLVIGKQPLFTTNVNWKAKVKGSGETIDVSTSDFATSMFNKLPPCNHITGVSEYAYEPGIGKIAGLYLDSRWRSLQCKNVDHDKLERAAGCFKNKVIYLIGDSTLRQWFLVLAKILALKENDNGDETVWQRPRRGHSASLNLTVHYVGHGSPLHGLGPPSSRPYVVDTLSDIKPANNGENLYIVINLALHFYLVDTIVYIKRLHSIRNSIKHLLEVSPDVTVMIRGCIRHKISKIAVPSEWFSYRLCKILRGMFRQLSNVGFVDTWSMTSAHPSWDTHPDDRTVEQHIALFMSYVCNV